MLEQLFEILIYYPPLTLRARILCGSLAPMSPVKTLKPRLGQAQATMGLDSLSSLILRKNVFRT
jgi:hypothetical protein